MGKSNSIMGEIIGKIGDVSGRKLHGTNIVSRKSNYFPVNHSWLRKKEFHDYLISLINEVLSEDAFVHQGALSYNTFEETETYPEDSIVWYKGYRYVCNTEVPAGPWNPNDWTKYNLREDIEDFGPGAKILFDSFIDHLYPVGSLYLTISDDFDPNEVFTGTTWQKLAAGRCLWSATSGGGEEIEAGLPNITGKLVSNGYAILTGTVTPSGALYTQGTGATASGTSQESIYPKSVLFDASRANDIYGNSDTVQPPAIKTIMWKRTT